MQWREYLRSLFGGVTTIHHTVIVNNQTLKGDEAKRVSDEIDGFFERNRKDMDKTMRNIFRRR